MIASLVASSPTSSGRLYNESGEAESDAANANDVGDESTSPFLDPPAPLCGSNKRTTITATPPLNALEAFSTLASLTDSLPLSTRANVAVKMEAKGGLPGGKKMRSKDAGPSGDSVCACGEAVAAENMAAHEERCPEKNTQCEFSAHGCYYVCRRADMARHHASALAVHSKLLCDQLRRLEAAVNNPLLSISWQVRCHAVSGGVDTSSDFAILVSGVHVKLFLTAKTSANGRLGVYVNRSSDLSSVFAIDIAGTTITLHSSEERRDITRTFPAASILEPSSTGLGFDFSGFGTHSSADALELSFKFRASAVDPVLVLTSK